MPNQLVLLVCSHQEKKRRFFFRRRLSFDCVPFPLPDGKEGLKITLPFSASEEGALKKRQIAGIKRQLAEMIPNASFVIGSPEATKISFLRLFFTPIHPSFAEAAFYEYILETVRKIEAERGIPLFGKKLMLAANRTHARVLLDSFADTLSYAGIIQPGAPDYTLIDHYWESYGLSVYFSSDLRVPEDTDLLIITDFADGLSIPKGCTALDFTGTRADAIRAKDIECDFPSQLAPLRDAFSRLSLIQVGLLYEIYGNGVPFDLFTRRWKLQVKQVHFPQ